MVAALREHCTTCNVCACVCVCVKDERNAKLTKASAKNMRVGIVRAPAAAALSDYRNPSSLRSPEYLDKL